MLEGGGWERRRLVGRGCSRTGRLWTIDGNEDWMNNRIWDAFEWESVCESARKKKREDREIERGRGNREDVWRS